MGLMKRKKRRIKKISMIPLQPQNGEEKRKEEKKIVVKEKR